MGMFDDISVYMVCPKCGKFGDMGTQTKDLTCALYQYVPLDEDWETCQIPFCSKEFREGLPVFAKFPKDKEHTVWENQAERIEAHATIPDEYVGQLNYINVHGSCKNCQSFYNGKIKVVGDKLVGKIYDIVL